MELKRRFVVYTTNEGKRISGLFIRENAKTIVMRHVVFGKRNSYHNRTPYYITGKEVVIKKTRNYVIHPQGVIPVCR